jgi:protein tyrosine/serine phosphatase
MWDKGLRTPAQRAHAWIDLLLFDHGVLRLFYRNRHKVTDRVWRSAQPAPADLKCEKARGVRSIVCVRNGYAFGSWPLEKEACERLELGLHKVNIRGRLAPSRAEMLELIDLLASIEYPALIHCKSGADRSGFVAAVYLLAVEGRSAGEAVKQLSWRYGHLRHSRAGILGEVIDAYRRGGGARGISFRQWIETEYDPHAIARGFKPKPIATAVADMLLRRET